MSLLGCRKAMVFSPSVRNIHWLLVRRCRNVITDPLALALMGTTHAGSEFGWQLFLRKWRNLHGELVLMLWLENKINWVGKWEWLEYVRFEPGKGGCGTSFVQISSCTPFMECNAWLLAERDRQRMTSMHQLGFGPGQSTECAPQMINTTILVSWRVWYARNGITHDKPLPSVEGSKGSCYLLILGLLLEVRGRRMTHLINLGQNGLWVGLNPP